MHLNMEPNLALQVHYQKNAEDRARAADWRLARDARRAARRSHQGRVARAGASSPAPRRQHLTGLHWLLGAVRSLRSAH
jgi:hypothetical protein